MGMPIASWCRAAAGCLLSLSMSSPASGQQLEAGALEQMEWRAIGPAVMGGRIDDVAVDERSPSTIYIGAASGGVWKSINAGTTWDPIFDDQPVSSIGDIALASSNPEIVWVGTGEPNNRQSSTFGAGVFKSTNGGRSWSHMGLRDSQHIARILVDPVDPNIVYVAALGRLWGPNTERGLFKTTDGGQTWANTKFIDQDTGFVDLVMDPANRQVLYAAAYQRRRTAWGFNGGGPGSGIYKTSDSGRSWKKLEKGLPAGVTGRIGLAVWRKDPRVVFATVEHAAGGIFRSNDGGETWRKVTDFNPRPMYYSKIHIDPTDDRRVYVLGSSMFVSDNGGEIFADPKTGRAGANQSMSATYDVGVHGDHHALWINPANPKHLLLGNDGGLYASYDGSISWDKINNIPLGQFYGVGVDMETPYNIYGGLQDTHSWGGPSATRHQIGILNGDWFQTNFGDGMYAQVDPTDSDTVYTESQGGNLVRFHRPTGDRKSIKPYPPPGEPPYRFNWTAPIAVSRRDPRTIYLGGNRVFKSTDRGDTWTAGADLTRAEDRSTLPIMGVLPSPAMLSRNDGVSAWGTITTLAESPANADVLWAGTDDGLVQLSRDGSATWTNITDRIPGPTPKGRISRVEPSHHHEGTTYVALDRHESDDFAPHLYVTRDFGQTWKALGDGLPPAGWINVVREHPRNARLLFVGTETGLFASLDGGEHWTRFTHGFPTVPVDDLVVHPRDNDLIVATHGRSLYVLDDLSPLSAMTAAAFDAAVHLFEPRPAVIRQLWKHESYGAQRQFIGPNPPQGATINYYLKTLGQGDFTITLRDSEGSVVRELKGSAKAGINRVVWDLRAAAPEGVTGARGPFVLPGPYHVGLAAGGVERSATLVVEADPALPVSDSERRARFAFLMTLNQLRGRIETASSATEAVAKQLEPLEKQTPAPSASRRSALAPALAVVTEKLRTLRQKLGGGRGGSEEEGGVSGATLRGAASGLFSEIDGGGVQQGSMTGPTPVQHARLAGVSKDLATVGSEWNRIVTADVAQLNAELKKLNLPEIVVPPR